MKDSKAFSHWVKIVRTLSRERYDATPEQMYGKDTKALGQSIRQFYRDWYQMGERYKTNITAALEELITDIEQKLETGVGTIDRGES